MSKDLSYRFLLTVTSLVILQGLGENKKVINFPLSSSEHIECFQTYVATSGLKAEFDHEECF